METIERKDSKVRPDGPRVLVVMFAVLLAGIMVWDMVTADRYFSATENRILAQKPEQSIARILNGSWESDYETYLTDQFVERDRWIGCKTYSEKVLGKKDINGVYLAKDGYLIERHRAGDVDTAAAEAKLSRLKQDRERYEELLLEQGVTGSVQVMLVPTADMILQDKLPAFAEDFDQREYLEGMQGDRVAVEHILEQHSKEEIYYRTDHHWTTLGAYYGYTAWAESVGIEAVALQEWKRTVVSENFWGTLHAKLNVPVAYDKIELFLPWEEASYQVTYDLGAKQSDSLYELSHLQTKNQYGVFLDDNHALIQIDTQDQRENKKGTLLVIKDSYANCLVPFLTAHYDTVYVLDKRYYRGSVEHFLTENQVEDILILYDVIHFMENY